MVQLIFQIGYCVTKLSDAAVTHVSSAYIVGVMFSKQFSKSLMYIKNSNGLKHEHCDVPH